MLHDIAPKKMYNQYRPDAVISPDSYLILMDRDKVLVRTEDVNIILPKAGDYPAVRGRYLCAVDEQTFFMVLDSEREGVESDLLSKGFEFLPIGKFRPLRPEWLRFAVLTAAHIVQWYDRSRFCGRCGKPNKHSDQERMVYCEDCRNFNYPKICPVVIVAIIRNEKILLTRYADPTRGGHYSLVAGFVEIGESIEEALHREVMEEVGLHVKNLRFYRSQPWAFSNSVISGFFCELDGDKHVTVDHLELETAKWATRDELPEMDGISVTREMMGMFKLYGRKMLDANFHPDLP